ncbi:hypothetical protein CARUB_v10012528mg [Capsella rubella]|uniref:Uncharacterized protein n=1 Tax=Capsella rubella TaxID=81985 RepID=R0I396_9BRAS|nr:uncharacterized protein LOC17899539 [Capsella rubella]EOA36734.1 hypothetical protein CARUB_v10012528mg [Capsella rubella]
MNLPSSTTPTTATSTSPSSDSTETNFTERCDDCGSRDSWVIHTVRLRGTLRFFCTHCLLRNHPTSFCPSCFAFYDSSPPHPSRRVTCSNSKCHSLTHIQCAGDAKPASSYLCPPCRNPTSFSFFRLIVDGNGCRSVDKTLSEAFLCAAKIAASSMNKAVIAAKCDADRRGREAALARKRAREALEHVVMLDEKEKARSVMPKLKESSVDRVIDQKPKLSPASNNGTVKETESSATTSTTTKNNGSTEKQNPSMQLAKVKQEADASR